MSIGFARIKTTLPEVSRGSGIPMLSGLETPSVPKLYVYRGLRILITLALDKQLIFGYGGFHRQVWAYQTPPLNLMVSPKQIYLL